MTSVSYFLNSPFNFFSESKTNEDFFESIWSLNSFRIESYSFSHSSLIFCASTYFFYLAKVFSTFCKFKTSFDFSLVWLANYSSNLSNPSLSVVLWLLTSSYLPWLILMVILCLLSSHFLCKSSISYKKASSKVIIVLKWVLITFVF